MREVHCIHCYWSNILSITLNVIFDWHINFSEIDFET